MEASYPSVRRFLPHLLARFTFDATPAGQAVLDALTFLRSLEGVRRPSLQDAPLEFVPAG